MSPEQQQPNYLKGLVQEALGYSAYRWARDDMHLGILESWSWGTKAFLFPYGTRLSLELDRELTGTARESVIVRDLLSCLTPIVLMKVSDIVTQSPVLDALILPFSKLLANGVIHQQLNILSEEEYGGLMKDPPDEQDGNNKGEQVETISEEVLPGSIEVKYFGLHTRDVLWNKFFLSKLRRVADLRSSIVIENNPKTNLKRRESNIKFSLETGEVKIVINDEVVAEKVKKENQGMFDGEKFASRLDFVARASLIDAVRWEKARQVYLGAGREMTTPAAIGSYSYAVYRGIESVIKMGSLFPDYLINVLNGVPPGDTSLIVYPLITAAVATAVIRCSSQVLGFNRRMGEDSFLGYRSEGDINPFKHLKDMSKGVSLLKRKEVRLVSFKPENPARLLTPMY